MLELLKVIFPYLIVLYLLDCISYLNKHQFIIGTLIGRRFNLKKNGIHLVGLLPNSQMYLAQNLPAVFTTDGMYYVPFGALNGIGIYRPGDFSFLPYKESGRLEIDEKSLKFNDDIIIKGPSNLYLRKLLGFLRRLASAKPRDRDSIIGNFVSKSYDVDEVKKIRKAGAARLLYLHLATYILFTLVFILTPLTIYSDLYLYINIYILVGYILIVYLFVLFYVGWLNKKLFDPDRGIRRLNFFSLILSPVNSIHASAYITKNLYHAFGLAALAAVFVSKNSFKELARKELFSIKKLQTAESPAGWKEYLEKKEAHLLKTMTAAAVTLDEILAPPEKRDEGAGKYCPICLTEYTRGPSICSDCETDLEDFEK